MRVARLHPIFPSKLLLCQRWQKKMLEEMRWCQATFSGTSLSYTALIFLLSCLSKPPTPVCGLTQSSPVPPPFPFPIPFPFPALFRIPFPFPVLFRIPFPIPPYPPRNIATIKFVAAVAQTLTSAPPAFFA
jgi:hypothetical protein